MSVTIKDVSNHAGVSIKTVSRVINNEENVAEATKSKVLASVNKLGFKPNKSAQSLRSKRSYMIALLYDNPNKSYLADIQNGILQVCKKSGYNLVLQECDYQDKNLSSSIIDFVEDFKIDGLIVTPPLSDMDDFLDNLKLANIQYSIIAPSTKKVSSPYVSSNDYDASYEMTVKIISLVHKKIGFVVGGRGVQPGPYRPLGGHIVLTTLPHIHGQKCCWKSESSLRYCCQTQISICLYVAGYAQI